MRTVVCLFLASVFGMGLFMAYVADRWVPHNKVIHCPSALPWICPPIEADKS